MAEEEKTIIKFKHLGMDSALNITLFNVVLVCIFGYGIVEKGMTPWHWFTFLGISFVFFVYMASTEQWKNKVQ